MRVAIQQRQRLFRDGLRLVLQAEAGIDVVGTAVSGDDLERLCDQRRPHVAVMEADATDWDSCALALTLHRRHPGLRFVGLLGGSGVVDVERIRRSGLTVLARNAGISPILEAVHCAQEGAPETISVIPALRPIPSRLSSRETAVLSLISGGWSSREISARLEISHKTVEKHKQRIFTKLGVQNQAHAVSVAIREGLLTPEVVSSFATAN